MHASEGAAEGATVCNVQQLLAFRSLSMPISTGKGKCSITTAEKKGSDGRGSLSIVSETTQGISNITSDYLLLGSATWQGALPRSMYHCPKPHGMARLFSDNGSANPIGEKVCVIVSVNSNGPVHLACGLGK
jgi:hypothetical protein